MSLKFIKDFSDDDMSADIEDAVVILRLKSNAFNFMLDLSKVEHYTEHFQCHWSNTRD